MEATGTFLWYCFNIVLYKLVFTFKSANKMLPLKWKVMSSTFIWTYSLVCGRRGFVSVTIQIKATEQYSSVALSLTLYKVVVTFESLNKILKCDHSIESY